MGVRKWSHRATRGLLEVEECTFLREGSEKGKDKRLCSECGILKF